MINFDPDLHFHYGIDIYLLGLPHKKKQRNKAINLAAETFSDSTLNFDPLYVEEEEYYPIYLDSILLKSEKDKVINAPKISSKISHFPKSKLDLYIYPKIAACDKLEKLKSDLLYVFYSRCKVNDLMEHISENQKHAEYFAMCPDFFMLTLTIGRHL